MNWLHRFMSGRYGVADALSISLIGVMLILNLVGFFTIGRFFICFPTFLLGFICTAPFPGTSIAARRKTVNLWSSPDLFGVSSNKMVFSSGRGCAAGGCALQTAKPIYISNVPAANKLCVCPEERESSRLPAPNVRLFSTKKPDRM